MCGISLFAATFALLGSVAGAYIPEPRPVHGPIHVSALYYPGTEHMPEWNMVEQVTPDAKPLLGWYDEGDPENVDWQIKWAVEHGINSFCVCWYWNKGVQRLDHWVKAFYRAKFRRYMKWYVMYANHNEPGSHSTEDQVRVTKFWIDNYFKTDEYYRIDGKPVVVYCTSSLLDRDFIAEALANGEKLRPGEGIRKAFAISDRLVKEAGLPGIYWIDMKWLRYYKEYDFDPSVYAVTKHAGFDAMMTYNLGGCSPYCMAPEDRLPGDRLKSCRYDLQVTAAKKLADHAHVLPGVPFFPTIPTGYDDSPRAFQRAWVVHSRTPEKFREACEYVRKVAEEKQLKQVMISPINEWQEGSYIEPCEKFGFAYYDVIRDVFCEKPAEGWPANVTPRSIGRKLREFPPMFFSPVQSWNFDSSTEGWYRQPFGCCRTRWVDGCLEYLSTRDNIFQIRQRMVPFPASKYGAFCVRMRIRPNAVEGLGRFGKRGIFMRLKWGTATDPIIGVGNGVDFQECVASEPVNPDGEWHEYRMQLAGDPFWKGDIEELWFEGANITHAVIDIDWMRFE